MLPDGGPWPPEPLAKIYDRFSVWSAWYSGDPDELSLIYGGAAATDRSGFFNSQTGGPVRRAIRSALTRWFWGAATPAHEQRTKLHVPIAGDIAATSADLLFSEPPALLVEDVATQDRINDLVDEGVHATLLEAAEVAAALGGVYLRVCWDTETHDRPWIATVHADAAVPEFAYGRLSAVTFWRVLADDGNQVLRHLERHERGVILHGLYQGDKDELGRPVPLTDAPETTELDDTVPTGLPMLTACYVPNMRPNRLWRKAGDAGYLGRSDYQGVEPLMDALDEVYSSWMRDIRLAKARLIVPEVYLQSQGRGGGAVFETEQEIFTHLNAMPPNDGAMAIHPAQFAIRVAEHRESASDFLHQIVRGAGYSAQTFGDLDVSGSAPVTATEITARERRSHITRDRKINYWSPALAQIIEVLLAIDATVFSSGVTPMRPDLEWSDVVSEDPQSTAQAAQLLRSAEAASTDTLVRLVNPEWDDDQVAEEVARIKDEGAMDVPGPVGMAVGPGTGDEPYDLPEEP